MMQGLLDFVFREEVAVLIPWQPHAHECAVYLEERTGGWFAGFAYNAPRRAARPNGLFDIIRGPYGSREAAIRNSVAHGVHHLFAVGLPVPVAVRIYRAAGVPIPPRWPRGVVCEEPPAEAEKEFEES